ncbi:MAG: isoprenylcysteine carboxylmethyltransferase family protein [Hyphomicrobium sp.]|jgi:protein-S-isoprenylcysteine O-methyltransferase Ste14|nr:isoprenylcysteine carboxylmethyltransferase family protein [Hyphomicrobium sp.]
MPASIELQAPLIELKGGLNRIDLSAWISGASFAAGMALAASPAMAQSLFSGGLGLYVLLGAFGVFIVSVLAIQRHMRLSLLANTFGAPGHLVTSGIFGYSRNPIYVAFFIPLASIAVFSISGAIAAIALYVLAMNLTVIRKEERDLLAAFGDEYAHYLSSAPRWLI